MNIKPLELLKKLAAYDVTGKGSAAKFSENQQLEFLMYFSHWMFAGPIKACDAIIMSGKNQKRDQEVEIAQRIKQSLIRGESLPVAMEQDFSKSVVSLFRIAQAAKGENGAIQMLSAYLEHEGKVKALKSAQVKKLLYPGVLVLSGLAAITFFGTHLVPEMAVYVEMMQVPITLGWPSVISSLLGTTLLYAVPFLGLAAAGLFIAKDHIFNNWKGEERNVADNYYPFTMFRAIKAIKLLKYFGMLLEHGTPTQQALIEIERTERPYMKYHLELCRSRMEQVGMPLNLALDTGLISKETLYRLTLLLESKDIEVKRTAIINCADAAFTETERQMQRTVRRLIVSMLLTFAGCFALVVLTLGDIYGTFIQISNFLRQ